jgi:hypothetical protein
VVRLSWHWALGFSAAQAAVVIMTGDDMARVGKRYLLPTTSTTSAAGRLRCVPGMFSS